MPGRRGGGSNLAQRRVTLAGQTFSTRNAAIRFLQDNPDYVSKRIGNLAKGSPKLLRDAGYSIRKVSRRGREGRHTTVQLRRGDDILRNWAVGNMPEPVQPTQYAHDRALDKKSGSKKKRPAKTATQNAQELGPSLNVPSGGADISTGIDYNALGAATGIDPAILKGLGPNVGNLIPLSLANRGAQPMGLDSVEALIKSLVGDSYSSQTTILDRERERTRDQNAHNLAQIERWYGQVMDSQRVAGERDKEFGRAAVASAEDTTRGIVSALGGEANEGSYMVGAAGQENIGNINAISAIQDQHNADIAPLLAGEKAGQLTREQALGGDRLRDLQMRMVELQNERGSKEAETRFQIWQANNDILDRRLQNELAIRQANTGLKQQRFQNQMGVRQFGLAAATAAGESLQGAAKLAQDEADDQRDSADKMADRQLKMILADAAEYGKNWRAQLSANKRVASKTYASATEDTRDSAWNDIVDSIDNKEMTPQQALKVATAIMGGYGWSMKNAAVQALAASAMREAGYDV